MRPDDAHRKVSEDEHCDTDLTLLVLVVVLDCRLVLEEPLEYNLRLRGFRILHRNCTGCIECRLRLFASNTSVIFGRNALLLLDVTDYGRTGGRGHRHL